MMNLHPSSLVVLLAGLLVTGSSLPAGAQPIEQLQPQTQPTVFAPDQGWRKVTPTQIEPQGTQFQLQSSLQLRTGEVIPATYADAEPLYLGRGEVRAATLVLNSPLQNAQGVVIAPVGSVITGQFQPVGNGSQFFAQSLTINNQTYPLSARSGIITEQRDPRQVSGGAIAEDALIGAAAGAILGGLLGDKAIATEEVLGAAAAGAVIGNVTAPNAVVVDANTPLNLEVTQDFQAVIF